MTNKKKFAPLGKWHGIVLNSQVALTAVLFVTELLANYILFKTQSRGYNPETFLSKLIRYQLVTTVINLAVILIEEILIRLTDDEAFHRIVLMTATVVMASNVAISHYQFPVTLAVFVIPILLSILYEETLLCNYTFTISLFGQTIAILMRGANENYSKDIGPEAAGAYALTICIFVLARVVMGTLEMRKADLSQLLIQNEQQKTAEEQAKLSLKILETLAHTIDAKDRYTNGHSRRVAVYSTLMAQSLGWSAEDIEVLKYQALLHDIGKIGVPDTVLNKRGHLSEIELKIIQSHAIVGADILKDLVTVPDAYLVAKHHHERYDGTGYPGKLSGDKIPLCARIVCIADTYDAMNSDRIYRKSLPKSHITEEMKKGRGTQFDPELLDVFLELLENNKLIIPASTNSTLEEEPSVMEHLVQDMENVIWRLSQEEGLKNFHKFYKYMRNIGYRYNRTIEVLSIHLTPLEGVEVTDRMLEEASAAMNLAIKKNIRAVDVYMQYTPTQHLIILLDAGTDNIEIITHRIYFDFSEIYPEEYFTVSHTLNEDIYLKTGNLNGEFSLYKQ